MNTRRALIFIFCTVTLDVLSLGLMIPVLPTLVLGFMDGDTAGAAEVFGVFATVWGLMQFLFSPLLGALSDRFGRRPIILISCLGLGLDYIFMALAPSLLLLFVGRVISGITAATISTAFAYIADVTKPEGRAKAFGLVGVGFGLGFVLGPAAGGLLGGMDPRLPFWVAAAGTLANAAFGWFVLPESLSPDKRMRFSWARANPVGALKLLASHTHLLGLSASPIRSCRPSSSSMPAIATAGRRRWSVSPWRWSASAPLSCRGPSSGRQCPTSANGAL
jgi:MFS transporter, DHA1 family, tetracycline resistance protein